MAVAQTRWIHGEAARGPDQPYLVLNILLIAARGAVLYGILYGITEIEADIDRQDQEQSQEEEDAVLEDLVDLETDRVLDHPLVGRQMKGLYPQGWVEGDIAYFNVENGRLCCKFPDGTSDLVMPSDFDGIDLVLL